MNKIAEKLRRMADAMGSVIEEKRRPMSQAFTPKRNGQYRSRLHEADNLERTQRALLALAYARETNQLPAELAGVVTKNAAAQLVHKSMVSNGYGDYVPSPDYADKSPAGVLLQAMIEKQRSAAEKIADEERERRRHIEQATDRLRLADIPGFFPTPAPLAERLVELAGVQPGALYLEPSAGIGSLVDALAAAGVQPASITAVECNHALCDVLRLKGNCNVVQGDFLQVTAVASSQNLFDRIVMNPPFERNADADHVMRAYEILASFGRLVAIVGSGTLQGHNVKATAFRTWLADLKKKGLAETESVPPGSFAGVEAFRRTGVSCSIVVIGKE